MEKILKEVLRRVKPRRSDRELLRKISEELVERTEKACRELGVPGKAMLVGSAARETWLRNERDIDIFILLPEDLSRGELERKGLEVARRVAGEKGVEKFAEHPYVTVRYRGFDVDLVPCYDIPDPSRIRSAVDRSPHHQRYVERRLTPKLIDEVLLLKQFLRGIGVYGAELQVGGFSGYLAELLVLYYGSFTNVVEGAARWEPGMVLDLRGEYPDLEEARALFPRQPLIVIDPVDPNRNASAAVSMRSFTTFVRACQDFLREPSEHFFFPEPVEPPTMKELEDILERRGTTLLAVVFDPPNLVPDILYPQLRKAERTMVNRLEREGFGVLRSDVWTDGKALILLELLVPSLPKVCLRLGPPLGVDDEDFIRKHASSNRRLAGPYVDERGRVVFEIERRYTDAEQVLRRVLAERVALGKHVAESVAKGYGIWRGRKVLELARDKKIRRFLFEYLTRSLPWLRRCPK